LDLHAVLPDLLPLVTSWAALQEVQGLATGAPLHAALLLVARHVGVVHPWLIRLALVEALPLPDDPLLRAAAQHLGVLGPDTHALTLGYAVFVRAGCATGRLVAHECRHVAQYEQAGGVAAFFAVYLAQLVQCGYDQAPLERDACAHEWHGAALEGDGHQKVEAAETKCL
jgi:hypothetical protein